MTAFFDSSALVKLVVAEADSDALRSYWRSQERPASSTLARVEFLRAVGDGPDGLGAQAREIVRGLDLIPLDGELLEAATHLDPSIRRPLDAIHLAAALRLGNDLEAVVTYDAELARAAAGVGLPVASPLEESEADRERELAMLDAERQEPATDSQCRMMARLVGENSKAGGEKAGRRARWYKDLSRHACLDEPIPLTRRAASGLIDALRGKPGRVSLAARSVLRWREESPEEWQAMRDCVAEEGPEYEQVAQTSDQVINIRYPGFQKVRWNAVESVWDNPNREPSSYQDGDLLAVKVERYYRGVRLHELRIVHLDPDGSYTAQWEPPISLGAIKFSHDTTWAVGDPAAFGLA
jgi:predicted nucleic acid-binding protein